MSFQILFENFGHFLLPWVTAKILLRIQRFTGARKIPRCMRNASKYRGFVTCTMYGTRKNEEKTSEPVFLHQNYNFCTHQKQIEATAKLKNATIVSICSFPINARQSILLLDTFAPLSSNTKRFEERFEKAKKDSENRKE